MLSVPSKILESGVAETFVTVNMFLRIINLPTRVNGPTVKVVLHSYYQGVYGYYFQKALDSVHVSHRILIRKLENVGHVWINILGIITFFKKSENYLINT